MTEVRQARVRAPELQGRRWLNTGGRPLALGELRGRIVLLDFWTFCCVNCLHVLDELRPVEAKYTDSLVVVGVHSPKFEHEKAPDAVASAVERYGVAHPVLDDPELVTWGQYAARAWPTLVVIDPEGYVVASMAGEGHADGLDRLLAELVAEHEAKGTLTRGAGPYVPPEPEPTTLRYPGKVVALPGGTLLVSDSAQHQLVEFAADATTELRRIGTGARGREDGAAASFSEPQGIAVLPDDVARAVGYDVVVADTVNHLLRGVRLGDGSVRTVAGTGRPWRRAATSEDALAVDLSSPWDVAWFDGGVVVAMAGIHQLWRFDPVRGTAIGYAGTTTESLRDGPVAEAFLAQPSGLAVDGDRLWFVDSESSALRYVSDGEVHTVIGTGLFDFGHADAAPASSTSSTSALAGSVLAASASSGSASADATLAGPALTGPGSAGSGSAGPTLAGSGSAGSGSAGSGSAGSTVVDSTLAGSGSAGSGSAGSGSAGSTVVGSVLAGSGLAGLESSVDGAPRVADGALLQHPLGLTVTADGAVLVADTYNGAVRRYEPESGAVTTIATGLAEPSDVLTVDGELLVVESGAHRLTRPPRTTHVPATERYRTDRPATPLAPGEVTVDVVFTAPPGTKLDETYGPATRLEVSANPPELLADGAGVGTGLSRRLVLSDAVSGGVLQVTAQAATCDAEAENPACHLTRQDWGVPVTLAPGAESRLSLILRG